MIYYFDTSALAKRYILESGSKNVGQIFDQADYIETLALTELELTALFERAKRERRLDSPSYKKVVAYLGNDIRQTAISLIQLDLPSWKTAKRLIKQRRLRVADAMQLAGAITTHERFSGHNYFVCSDENLLQAAKLEGLHCIDPTD